MKRNWRNWFGLGDDGIDEEIRAHLHQAIEERIARGENRREAEFAARREFGNVTHVTELTREMRRGAWLVVDDFVNVLAHAVRRLVRSPGYCVPVILSLALGVGLNAAVFAVLDHVVRRPLPFVDGERLVALGAKMVKGPAGALASSPTQWALYERDKNAWLGGAQTIESYSEYASRSSTVVGDAPAERADGAWASPDHAKLLGVQPERGRWFALDDGPSSVVVVSHSLWQRQFAGVDDVLGRTLRVDGEARVIVGVMPPNASFPFGAEFWIPSGNVSGGEVIARLKPGASIAQTAAELESRSASLANLRKGGYAVSMQVLPLRVRLFGSAREPVRLLFGATILLLLLACANVANLALTRTLERRREVAVRLALGASRRSLAGLIVVENVTLALLGAAFGLLVAWWGTRVVVAIGPEEILTVPGLGVGVATVLFAAAIAVGAALIVSIAPILALNERSVHPVLGQAGAPMTRGATAPGVRRILVAVQIAASLILITGSGLLFRSIGQLTRPDHLGFSSNGVVIASLSLLGPEYRGTDRGERLMRELAVRARSLPGVQAVALGPPPLVGGRGEGYREGFNMLFSFRDRANPDGPVHSVWTKHVDESYLDVYGIRLRAGRGFRASDDSTAPFPVAILTASAAKLFFPDRDPINQPLDVFVFTRGGATPPTVVGVVDDILQRDLALEAFPEVLLSAAQQSKASWAVNMSIRSTAPPETIIGGVRQILKSLDPSLAAARLQSMQSVVDASLRRHSFIMSLLGALAALGLTLSLIGLYAVVSYLVTQRTLEIGVRMALGAQRGDVLRLMLREGATLIVVGIAVGIPASLVFARLLGSFLFEVKPTDVTTLVTATMALTGVALVAAWLPAQRASGIDPASTLRSG